MDTKSIWRRTQELVADPFGTWARFENFQGTTNQRYEDLHQKLSDTGFPVDDTTVVLPAVPAGTLDLSAYAATGKPLEKLFLPIKVWWKQAGLDDTNYNEVPDLDTEPDVLNTQGIQGFVFKAGILYVSPSTIAIDIRVEGEFLFPELVSPDDPIRMSNVNNILSYMIAAALGVIRGNEAWATGYEQKAEDQLDVITRKLVKNAQNITRRVGRMSRRGRTRRRLHLNSTGT